MARTPIAPSLLFGNKQSVAPPVDLKARNVVGLLLDASGSMSGARASALMKWVNEQILNVRQQSYDAGQATLLGVGRFASMGDVAVPTIVYSPTPVEGARLVLETDYSPYGSTPLLQAIQGMTNLLVQFATVDAAKFSSTGVLLIVATDGKENASPQNVRAGFADWLRNLPPYVTIGFIGPGSMVSRMVGFGFSRENCLTWDGDAKELETSVSAGTQSAYSGYTQARSKGAARSTALFVDAADKSAEFAKLPDLKAAFKQIVVDKEGEIAPFVRDHGLPYVLGRAFYQLTKTERIQPHKKVALRDKKSGRIVAGEQVKTILGVGSNGELRIKPGNLGNFDMFVSSTSMNRKLVRGTKLLYAKKEIA